MKRDDRVRHAIHGEGTIRVLSPEGQYATVKWHKDGTDYVRTHAVRDLEPVIEPEPIKFNGRFGTVATEDDRNVSWNDFVHPEMTERIRFKEVAMSDCPLGCKAYQHDKTGEVVIMHNSNYGCRR
jgi:hypothetical protein